MTQSAAGYRIISARVSPMVELARWLFERQALAYREYAHAPMLHVWATKAAGGGVEVPVVITPTGEVWAGARETIAGLDRLSGGRLLGEDPAQRAADSELVERLLTLLLQTVRRYVYHAVIGQKPLLYPTVTHRAPAWERAFVWWLYPVWRELMARGLDFSPEALAEAEVSIEQALNLIDAELVRRGTPFLSGQAPGTLDVVFSALAGPLVFPPNYGARLPAYDQLPSDLKAFTDATRTRACGELVLETYKAARFPDN